MPRWLLYVVLVFVALVLLAIVRAVLRKRRRHVRRQVIDDRLDVPERTSIADRLDAESLVAGKLVACSSCGHQHQYTSGVRSGSVLLLDCPSCGRRTPHEHVG